MISVEDVKGWFQEEEDLYDYDLNYADEGDLIEMDSIPEGYTVRVVANEVETSYASYGYTVGRGFIVFSVTSPEGESETFKLPMGYESFEGWSIDVNDIVVTERKEKIVTTWEWI